jgi:hypothetical protein
VIPFEQYKVTGIRATFHRVPIALLDEFRKAYPGMFKLRYRGPRFNTPSARYRSYMSKSTTCLKEDAVAFSAYRY